MSDGLEDVVAANTVMSEVDGQRGVLGWEFELPAGEKKAVQLDSVMRWPEGKELQ